MPETKSKYMSSPSEDTVMETHCADCCTTCSPKWGESLGKKIMWTLSGVLVVYLIFFVGTLTRNEIKKFNTIGLADQNERSITVTGTGKVSGNNDIAVTSIGYSNVDSDVAKAQVENKKVMDGVLASLKEMGVAEKDLQTNYSVYPEYNYTQDKGQQLIGYRVSNTVSVKIRDLSKIPSILGLAGKFGATQVNGLSFTIDDAENLKAQARQKALLDAGRKASLLAAQLGVRLVGVMAYNEYDSGVANPMPMYKLSNDAMAVGMGGGGAPEAVQSGSQDVVMSTNVTYQILPLNY